MIRGLADTLRNIANEISDVGHAGWPNALNDIADDLEAALPIWTEITEDSETVPDPEQDILFQSASGGLFTATMPPRIIGYEFDRLKKGVWWRPLCDLDYPPEKGS